MKCANGCDAPVSPPSKVICRGCQDKITQEFCAMHNKAKKEELWKLCSDFMEEHRLEPSLNPLINDDVDENAVYELVEKICTLIGWSPGK